MKPVLTKFKKFGEKEILLLVVSLVYAFLSFNVSLTLWAVIVPFILMKLTWREREAPLLFFAMLMQWLAITAKVFYANYGNMAFDDPYLHRYPDQVIKAYYFALISLVSLSLGIHLAIRSYSNKSDTSLLDHTAGFKEGKLARLYILTVLFYPIIFRVAFSLGGLHQPILKLIEYKWSIFFIFLLFAFHTNHKKIFLTIFFTEFVLSLTGFFSAFKDYFLIAGIGGIVIFKDKFKAIYILPTLIIIGSAIYMLLAWSYIKPAYRTYLNDGTAQQISVRSTSESLGKMYELVSSIDSTAISEGFEITVDRVSYIDFLSATMSNVPSQVKHTDGKLWLNAIEKVLKPRLFFPDKEVIDDSAKTRLYTGSAYAGAEEGASISLGYFAESYVDFGEIGMIIVLFAHGILIGLVYRYVMVNSPDKLIGTALLIPFFFTINSYENALDKNFVAIVLYLVFFIVFKNFILKKMLTYLKSD